MLRFLDFWNNLDKKKLNNTLYKHLDRICSFKNSIIPHHWHCWTAACSPCRTAETEDGGLLGRKNENQGSGAPFWFCLPVIASIHQPVSGSGIVLQRAGKIFYLCSHYKIKNKCWFFDINFFPVLNYSWIKLRLLWLSWNNDLTHT